MSLQCIRVFGMVFPPVYPTRDLCSNVMLLVNVLPRPTINLDLIHVDDKLARTKLTLCIASTTPCDHPTRATALATGAAPQGP